jgi:glycosyltransferase involved in cell wall biosynthesis
MLISIILPLAKNENKQKIIRCLDSLKKQSFQKFELLIITSPKLAQKLSSLFREYKFTKIHPGHWSKSAARNEGAKKAKGQFLFHLDADMKLSSGLLLELVQKTKKGKVAVVVPCPISKNVNFWGKCRGLEAKLISGDSVLESPIFIKKSLFQKMHGYDEKLDPLDDWGLHLALKKHCIKFARSRGRANLYVSPSLKDSFQRVFERSRAVPILKERYPNLPQVEIKNKIELYKRKRNLLYRFPIYTLGLLFLKITDLVAFSLGKYFPKEPYRLSRTSLSYEERRLGSNFTRYKHFAEVRGINRLLEKPSKIIEVGCGTGRITAELIKKGHQIIPIDPSEKMLKEFKKKKGFPKPKKASGEKIPFRKDEFETSLSLRVIWHCPLRKAVKIVSEMNRVSSQLVILDIVNEKRFLTKYLRNPNTYPVSLKEFLLLCKKKGLEVQTIIPLDVSLPFWLNLLPQKLAERCFPALYKLDLTLAKIIQPGRYLLKLVK